MPPRDAFESAKLELTLAHETNSSLCTPFTTALSVTGAAVSVLVGPFAHSTVCASDPAIARVDEIQFDVGEGPCLSALASRAPVLYGDFRDGAERWPAFTEALMSDPLGPEIRGLYAFPLTVGTLDIGAIDLYSTESDPFDEERITKAKTLASLVGWQVLRRILAGFDDDDEDERYSRREVHQATGMILAQLNTSASDARLLLHAHAYASDRSVMEVAEDVVARRIDFSEHAPI